VTRILKSDGLIVLVGSELLITNTLKTVVTPLIVREFIDTVSTFANVFVDKPGFENATIFPVDATPTNIKSDEVTVLIPPEPAVIETCPTEKKVEFVLYLQ
jgi:hypothetical protein